MNLWRCIFNPGNANVTIALPSTFRAIGGSRRVFDGPRRRATQRRWSRSRRWLSTGSSCTGRNENDSSHAMRGSYKDTSGNQYSAHLGCQDMLLDCARRLKEQRNQENDHSQTQTWKIVDLGSADGSNSIQTIDTFLEELSSDEPNGPNVHIIFEEHPSSDESRLTETVASWLETKTNSSDCKTKIRGDVLMKSFYESLFEDSSIDFCMSYICLHWLDSNDIRGKDGIRDWKHLHLDEDNKTREPLDGFLQVNERTAPQELKVLWKRELADHHLARFLTLRARELKPGAELLLVMVSDPHEYWRPERSYESPLLKAMKDCVADGSIRPQVLERAIVPYYLRKPQDILDALVLAKQLGNRNPEAPIHLLDIIDIRQYETLTGAENEDERGDGMKGARELFWAIHGGAVVNVGGANEREAIVIKNSLVKSFDESFDPRTGIVKGNFIACVFRKKIQRTL